MIFVFDASSLIIFHQTNLLPLVSKILTSLKAKAILLSAVEEELLSVPTRALGNSLNLEWVDFIPRDDFIPQLGRGERAVIEYVSTQEKIDNYICVLDDSKARILANSLDIRVVGSLGITGIGYEICSIKTIKDLENIWQNWRSLGFRIPLSKELEKYNQSLNKD